MGPPLLLVICIGAIYAHYGDVPALRHALTGVASAAAGLMLATVAKMARPLFRSGTITGPVIAFATFASIGVLQWPLPLVLAVIVPVSIAAARVRRRNSGSRTLATLARFFVVLSPFAIGLCRFAVPEMHRFAVDVEHWLSNQQFADSFALAQLTPGPNIIIVTLIGYHVAGIIGALITTLAMCGPPAVFAFFVGGASDRFKGAVWHGVLSRALGSRDHRPDRGERRRRCRHCGLRLDGGDDYARHGADGLFCPRASAVGFCRRRAAGAERAALKIAADDLARACALSHGSCCSGLSMGH